MAGTVLRKKNHGCVDEIDERYLKLIYSYLKDFTDENYEIGKEEKDVLDTRRAAYKSGKTKGLTLEEVNRKLQKKSKK